MSKKFKKIFGLVLTIIAFMVGLLGIYRGTLKTASLTKIQGKVLTKRITFFRSIKSGSHYFLVFNLENKKDKISINLGTKEEASTDSAYDKIDTGKYYTFYLDPTVPTLNGENPGIRKVEFDGVEVYRASNKLNLYGGVLLTILGLAGTIIILMYKK